MSGRSVEIYDWVFSCIVLFSGSSGYTWIFPGILDTISFSGGSLVSQIFFFITFIEG